MLKGNRCYALLFPGRSKIQRNEQHNKESDTIAVLRVKLHCPACVSEVTRSLQRVNGVIEVSADAKAEMITVKGSNLEARRLCEGVLKKTGKRCEVLLLSSIEELNRNSESSAAAADHQPTPEVNRNGEAAATDTTAITVTPVTVAVEQQQHQGSLQDMSEPRIEINHQTHTVIYGWPSQYLPPQPLLALDYSYAHEPHFRYEELLSDENPNACKLM